MKIKKLFLCALLLCSAPFAFAEEKLIECKADGKKLSVNGSPLRNAKADFTFTETKNEEGLRVLENIEGSFETLSDENETEYLGRFKIDALDEDELYKPRKYKGFSRFHKFTATDTKGSVEEGMWGYFLLEKNTEKKVFQAHYVFQAGDHMGGTLHLNCSKL